MWSVVLKAIVAAIVAILGWLGSPGAEPTAPDGPVPWAPGTETTAGVFALLRAVDPCALHDVTAAVAVTGDQPDQIMPSASLASCQLRLHRGDTPTWSFTIEVGVVFPTAARHAATSEEVDGTRLYRTENTPPSGRACGYVRPMGPDHGISLTAVAPVGAAPPSCTTVRAYLTAVQSLSRLVLRMQQHTQPQLELASIDPCSAAPAILERLGVPGSAYPQALYACQVQPELTSTAPAATAVTIRFGFGADPSGQAGSDSGHTPVTVDGHHGVVDAAASPGQECVLTLAHLPGTAVVQIGGVRWVQTISVQASSCAQATALAGVVVHAVSTQ